MQSIEERLKGIEDARRGKQYPLLNYRAEALRKKTISLPSIEYNRIEALITYELHMAADQRARESNARRAYWFRRAIKLGEDSVMYAQYARNELGMLMPRANIFGRIWPEPEINKWQEGLVGSRQIRARFLSIATRPEISEIDRDTAWRWVMNCDFHQLRILTTHEVEREEMLKLLDRIEENVVYQREFRTEQWAQDDIARAYAVITKLSA